MLSVILLNVVRLNVIMLTVLAPFESAPFHIENTNLLCKTSYHNEEINCTESSPSVSIPWSMLQTFLVLRFE